MWSGIDGSCLKSPADKFRKRKWKQLYSKVLLFEQASTVKGILINKSKSASKEQTYRGVTSWGIKDKAVLTAVYGGDEAAKKEAEGGFIGERMMCPNCAQLRIERHCASLEA